MRKRLLVVGKNVGLVLVTMLVTLGTVEISAFLYVYFTKTTLPNPPAIYPARPDRAEQPDERLGWALKPNFSKDGIQINSASLRSSVDDLTSFCTGKKVILIVGDSMVFGYRVDQDYIFTEILNRESDNYCFINTGVIGYTTTQQFISLNDYLDDFNIDTILWFFTQGNDIWGNARGGFFNPYFSMDDGKLKQVPPKMEIETPFYKNTTTFRLLDEVLLHGRDMLYVAHRMDFMIRGGNSYPWVVTEKILGRVADLANSYQIPLIMLDIPSIGSLKRGEGDANKPNGSVLSAPANAKEVTFSVGDRYALLASASKRIGFTYVRVWDYYPKDFQSIFIPDDPHWNEKGHQVIADLVLRVLQRQEENGDGASGSASDG